MRERQVYLRGLMFWIFWKVDLTSSMSFSLLEPSRRGRVASTRSIEYSPKDNWVESMMLVSTSSSISMNEFLPKLLDFLVPFLAFLPPFAVVLRRLSLPGGKS